MPLLPSGAIAEDQIRLYQRRYLADLDDGSGQVPYIEVEVPIHMVGEGDNFDGDDFFIFYGLRLRDDGPYEADLGNGPETVSSCAYPTEINNATNFYWLAASEPDPGQSWARMETTTLPAANPSSWSTREPPFHRTIQPQSGPSCQRAPHPRGPPEPH